MARIRSVHPDICASETMAALSGDLERCFVRLWTHCDDEGRCKDSPVIIAASIFAANEAITSTVIDGWLDDLAKAGLIVRYEANGTKVVAITGWHEYQHPQRPKKSDLPGPTEASAKTRIQLADDSRTHTGGRGGEKEMEKEGSSGAVPAPRKADPIWDALIAACGLADAKPTSTERGAWNTAVKQLRDIDAEPAEIHVRARAFVAKWPGASLTPTALARRWNECVVRQAKPAGRAKGADAIEEYARMEGLL